MTAPSTDQGKDYGYVFWNCRLTSDKETSKVYLARPWRPYAQVVYIECELGKHIVPAGWNNWGKASNEKPRSSLNTKALAKEQAQILEYPIATN